MPIRTSKLNIVVDVDGITDVGSVEVDLAIESHRIPLALEAGT